MRLDLLAASAALLLWIGGGSWYWVCKVKNHCGNAVTEAPAPAPAPATPSFTDPGLLLADGDSMLTLSPNALLTMVGDSGLAANNPAGVKALFDLLQAREGSFLEITGHYLQGNPAENSGLGIRRAQALGEMLTGMGLDPNRLVFSYDGMSDALIPDSLLNALRLRLLPPAAPATEEEIAVLFEPRDLYFDTGSAELPIEDDFRTYCGEVIRYLRSHPDARIAVTGHTDNQGSAAKNQQLGMERAQTVAGILASFGMAETQLNIRSEGQKKPIAPNTTPEGRAQNRRVEVRLNN